VEQPVCNVIDMGTFVRCDVCSCETRDIIRCYTRALQLCLERKINRSLVVCSATDCDEDDPETAYDISDALKALTVGLADPDIRLAIVVSTRNKFQAYAPVEHQATRLGLAAKVFMKDEAAALDWLNGPDEAADSSAGSRNNPLSV
jgi:hypothetical protein